MQAERVPLGGPCKEQRQEGGEYRSSNQKAGGFPAEGDVGTVF